MAPAKRMWPAGLIASFASDVEYSFLSNVRPLGSHGKKREQGCSRYYGSMPRAQSKGCRFEEEEILAQRPGDPEEEKWNQPLMKMMKTDDGLPGRASHPCLSVWIPPSLLELWRTRSGCVLFSSSFVVFEHFVVHPLQPLWRDRSPFDEALDQDHPAKFVSDVKYKEVFTSP